jgi:hypothetical protein
MGRMLTLDEQTARLTDFMRDTAGWNVMILCRAPGDVVTLRPICPKLANVEVVIALDDNQIDLWRNGRAWKMGLTHAQAAEFLRSQTPSEAEFMAHGAEWAEKLFKSLGMRPTS